MKKFNIKFLSKQMLINVIRETIERLDAPEAADALEQEIYRARAGGLLDDKTFLEMQRNINLICQQHGWTEDQNDGIQS